MNKFEREFLSNELFSRLDQIAVELENIGGESDLYRGGTATHYLCRQIHLASERISEGLLEIATAIRATSATKGENDES